MYIKVKKTILVFVLVSFCSMFVAPRNAFADTSCTAVVSTNSLFVGQSVSLTLKIENTGTDDIVLAYLYKPGAGYVLTGASSAGWDSILSDESRLTLQNGRIAPGTSTDFSIQVSTDADPVDLASLNIQATNLADGNGLVDCGTPTFAVIQTTAPVLSGVTISDVTDHSAKISWLSDHAANSHVEYGTTQSYGSLKNDISMSQTHSFIVDSLSANTTYHAKISGTDGDGFVGQTSDFTFATAASGQIVTQTVTVATTTTKTITVAAPMATPIPDTTPPVLKLLTSFTGTYPEAPTLAGTATDASGIASVEVSTDGGKNWLPADGVIPGQKSVSFHFTPGKLLDGNYSVVIRSKDLSGNSKKTKENVLVIDRLPPSTTGALYTSGPFSIFPDSDGNVPVVSGTPVTISFTAVGGPTAITLSIKDASVSAKQNIDSRLWTANVTPSSEGIYPIHWYAIDGAKNTSEGSFPTLVVTNTGKTSTTDASISVYSFDSIFGTYTLWHADQYGQRNPQKVDETGRYHLLLPAGNYYLSATGPGMKTATTDRFSLESPAFIRSSFDLHQVNKIYFGPFAFRIPDFASSASSVELSQTKTASSQWNHPLLGKELPHLEEIYPEALSLRGKATIISVLSSWLPQTAGQLTFLSRPEVSDTFHTLVILEGDSVPSVSILASRGNYTTTLVADPDSRTASLFSLRSLPTHIFVDRKGIVRKVLSGELHRSDIVLDFL